MKGGLCNMEVMYWMWRHEKVSKITFDRKTKFVEVENYSDKIYKLPFGIRTNISYNDFEEFIADRVVPKTRYDIKHVLELINVPYYDPWLIIKVNHGLQYEDYGWLLREGEDIDYDVIKIRD